MSNLTIAVFFTKNTGESATGLTLADIDLYMTAQNKSTGAEVVIWNGSQHPTKEISNIGAYIRIYADADFDIYNYYVYGDYTGAVDLDSDHVQGSSSGPDSDEIASAVWEPEYLTNVGTTVWSAAGRTLTQGTVPTSDVVSGNKITVYRGTTWSIPIEQLGEIGDDDILYFTVKTSKSNADSAASLQLRVGGDDPGLLRFNGAETDRGDGSIEIVDATIGNVIIRVDESVTVNAVPHSLQSATQYYDFKHIKDGDLQVKSPGYFIIEADVTMAIE